jgi:CheY-like chemotaxis protein
MSNVPTALILLVDDHDDSRELYAEQLVLAGLRVEEALDGPGAVKKAAELLPDAIVMDLSLPVFDGYEATRQLRASEATKHIPVIALSGHAEASHGAKARSVGINKYLTKPCLPDVLMDAVYEQLKRKPR